MGPGCANLKTECADCWLTVNLHVCIDDGHIFLSRTFSLFLVLSKQSKLYVTLTRPERAGSKTRPHLRLLLLIGAT